MNTTTTTKGTPRKRPYDIKRKLLRAGRREAKAELIQYTFGDMVCIPGGAWACRSEGRCLLSAFVEGKPVITQNIQRDAAHYLGLTPQEVGYIVDGFDSSRDTDYDNRPAAPDLAKWFDLAVEIRKELLGK